ncbi:helix-turn-helix domain-containing protein [Qipengyuania qiaonensis]|uniref:AraC family transcriptional regulator n=1 Tax=Qipengyuania qiaonensis TaxID=2867240 RepID=A0ABS7J306_9SPHN|nr:AraC family transcriptional regulator [Qipengyuania qiaonensis]MBX7481704.1 AraC family transcriptional regulator [Qipengyuania qiaonensis]
MRSTYLDYYAGSRLADYVTTSATLADGIGLLEARQPAGDMSDEPNEDYVLTMNITPGVAVTLDFGFGRWHGMAGRHNLIVLPPATHNQVVVDGRHSIRCVSLHRDRVARGFETLARSGAQDLGRMHRDHFDDALVCSLVSTLFAAQAADACSTGLLADDIGTHLVARLLELQGRLDKPKIGGLAPWQIRRVTEAIASSDAELFSLDQLADLVGLSSFHFCRAFRTALGISPFRYQQMIRIERARSELESSSRPVTEIALASGYGSSQAFARAFRRETGVSPLDYRKARA